MQDNYSDLGLIYDRLNPKSEIFAQKPLYKKLFDQYGVHSVLDVACGNGHHLALFRELGAEVSGSDLSPTMIANAKSNLGQNTVLKVGDYRELPSIWSNEEYDLVVCLTTSLPYMQIQQDLVKALNSMYSVLKPDGVLVIDNGISDKLLREKPTFLPGRVNRQDAFYFFLEYPENKIVFNILYVNAEENQLKHFFTSEKYSAMTQDMLSKAFQQTKFSEIKYYGDYQLTPYSDSSDRLLVIAQK